NWRSFQSPSDPASLSAPAIVVARVCDLITPVMGLVNLYRPYPSRGGSNRLVSGIGYTARPGMVSVVRPDGSTTGSRPPMATRSSATVPSRWTTASPITEIGCRSGRGGCVGCCACPNDCTCPPGGGGGGGGGVREVVSELVAPGGGGGTGGPPVSELVNGSWGSSADGSNPPPAKG